MFARKVAARLKPNSLAGFTNLMEREVLPWLRKQSLLSQNYFPAKKEP
jgi:hypothetical protein